MASIKDVAKLAGVGLGTASRALTCKGYVAPETKKKIEEAARILRYRPNVLAQNLQKNKS
ncbi:MAG TPA: LacI family DNA-binding transcriptional regulator, partial [Candidatus Blautia pullicola]|nr:LacI family DNA-binding transcriptional regulator [Candidatus Blautia pullicola]